MSRDAIWKYGSRKETIQYDPTNDSSASESDTSDEGIMDELLPRIQKGEGAGDQSEAGKESLVDPNCATLDVSLDQTNVSDSSESVATMSSSTEYVSIRKCSTTQTGKKSVKDSFLERKSHSTLPREKSSAEVTQSFKTNQPQEVAQDAERVKEHQSLGLRKKLYQRRGEKQGLVTTTTHIAACKGLPAVCNPTDATAGYIKEPFPEASKIESDSVEKFQLPTCNPEIGQLKKSLVQPQAKAQNAAGDNVNGKVVNQNRSQLMREKLHQRRQEKAGLVRTDRQNLTSRNTEVADGNVRNPFPEPSEEVVPTLSPAKRLKVEGDFGNLLVEKLRNVTMEDVTKHDWSKFSILSENDYQEEKRAAYGTLDHNYSNLPLAYDNLRTFVLRMESTFEAIICFPPEELDLEIENIRRELSAPIDGILGAKFNHFAEEYRTRNNSIAEIEHEGALGLIDICKEAYCENIKNLLGNIYLDDASLQGLFDLEFKRIERDFVAACDFKHSYWNDEYKRRLEKALQNEEARLIELNEGNKAKLEITVQGCVKNCVAAYKKMMDDFIREESTLDSVKLKELDAVAVATSKSLFDQDILELKGQHADILNQAKRHLDEAISDTSNKMRQKTLKSLKKPNCTDNRSAQPSARQFLLPENPFAVDSFRDRKLSFELLKDFMVLYLGFDKFRVGYFPANVSSVSSANVTLLLEEDIVLYLRRHRLVFKSSELQTSEETFVGSFLKEPIGKKYVARYNANILDCNFEDCMKILLENLKNEIQDKTQHKSVSRCVICVPQCLNLEQRSAIDRGVTNAGFNYTYLISDTTAIAFNYLSRNPTPLPAKIIAANFSEASSYDVAWFTANEEHLQCSGVSGNCFIDKPGMKDRLLQWIPGVIYTYNKLEVRMKKIFAREKEEGNVKKGNRGRIFVVCRSSSDSDSAKVMEKHFNRLFRVMKPYEKDYALKGAAQLAKLINCIEADVEMPKKEFERLKKLKASLLNHQTRDETQSFHEPA